MMRAASRSASASKGSSSTMACTTSVQASSNSSSAARATSRLASSAIRAPADVAEREERLPAPALQRRLVLRVLGSVDARERRLGQRERLGPPLGQQVGFDDARLGLHHFDPATQARERVERLFEQRHRFVVAAHPGQRATEAARRGSRAERVARRGPHAAGVGLRDLGCLEPSEVRVVLTDVVRHARRARRRRPRARTLHGRAPRPPTRLPTRPAARSRCRGSSARCPAPAGRRAPRRSAAHGRAGRSVLRR